MLHRTNPLGHDVAGWMCMDCIKAKEPELANNIKSEPDYDVLRDIESVLLDDDDDHFEHCAGCDLPDACSDFGCAEKQGLKEPNDL